MVVVDRVLGEDMRDSFEALLDARENGVVLRALGSVFIS
jgi:hypothetical protein